MATFHIRPPGSEELGVLFKGFTFIVIGEEGKMDFSGPHGPENGKTVFFHYYY